MRFRKDFFGCVDLICLSSQDRPLSLVQVKTNARGVLVQNAKTELTRLSVTSHAELVVVVFIRRKSGWFVEYHRTMASYIDWKVDEVPLEHFVGQSPDAALV